MDDVNMVKTHHARMSRLTAKFSTVDIFVSHFLQPCSFELSQCCVCVSLTGYFIDEKFMMLDGGENRPLAQKLQKFPANSLV